MLGIATQKLAYHDSGGELQSFDRRRRMRAPSVTRIVTRLMAGVELLGVCLLSTFITLSVSAGNSAEAYYTYEPSSMTCLRDYQGHK